MSDQTSTLATRERVIQPRSGLSPVNVRELWIFRELFVFLTVREILIRYKQSVMGILWAVIRPVMLMIVFTLIFGKMAKLSSDGVPYPILTMAGLLPWQFFQQALTRSSDSMVRNPQFISKIYFPRLIIPFSTILAGIVEFLISFTIFIGLMVYFKIVPTVAVFWTPAFFLLALTLATGIGLWASALNVKYRDVRQLVPFAVQFGMYISPVGFSTTNVPEKYQFLYSLNPLVGVIDGFRWSLLGAKVPLNMSGLALSCVITVIILVSGLYYFKSMERKFADII